MKLPHVRLPENVDEILLCLTEELKSNKFFDGMADIGLIDEGNARCSLSYMLIQKIFKLNKSVPDELGQMYFTLLKKHTDKLKQDYTLQDLYGRAFKLYVDIMCEKKRLKSTGYMLN